MKKLSVPSLLVAVLAVFAATAAQAAKIEICHIPPGNPDNWHTITINDTALSAHQAHGDLVGSCLANCGTLCDDGNKCTIDFVSDTNECLCQAETRPAVDCNDGLACTANSCDPTQGCQSTPVVCTAPNPCTASVCSEPAGTCEDTPVVCPTGQACNATTGACESSLPPCGNCLINTSTRAGCEVIACEAVVCAVFDGVCCIDSWDNFGDNTINCANHARTFCVDGGLCTAGPAD